MKEIATSESDLADAESTPQVPERPTAKPKAKAPAPSAEAPQPAGERLGPELRAVRTSEDASLRELLDQIGNDGSYRVRVTRKSPADSKDPITGRAVKTEGFLKTYEGHIDETMLKEAHGGGTYELKISRKTPAGGFVFFAQRTVNIAGDPDLDDPCLTRIPVPATGHAPVPAQPPTTPAESPTIVGKAMDIMASQIDAMREDRNGARPSDELSPAVTMLMQMMKETLDKTQAQLEVQRREGAVKPAEDPFKDNLLNNLMREDNARLSSVRAQFESEIRILKENAQQEQRRLEDRHERYQSDARQSHERELANVRQSHELSLQAVRASFETQAKLLEGEVRRLDRDNTEMRAELKDLRAKHGKGIVEQAKELNAVKEALGIGEGGEEPGTVDKVIGVLSSPAAINFADRFMAGRMAAAPPVPPAQAKLQQPRNVEVDGKKYRLMPDGKLIPLRTKPKIITATLTNPDGTPGPTLTLPAIPPEMSAQVTEYLERAFAANTDPVIVAQSGRTMVPPEIMAVIREHGVDVFLQKVARLPGGSPLSTQAGKNWVRKVGEALVE